jgi:Flp pilus assembly protein TadG
MTARQPAPLSSRRRRRSRGQGLVEFALVAPVLFFLIFGIVEAGRFILYYHALNNAVREGARYAILHGPNAADGCPSGPLPANVAAPKCYDPNGDNVRAAVVDSVFGLMAADDVDIPDPEYFGPNGNTNARGSNVRVTATYTYEPVLPLLPSIDISAESTLVVNN